MPHFPKPFFRTARQAWFVEIAGRQVNLGPDKDTAFRSYHGLMLSGQPTPPRNERVVDLIDEFLESVHENQSAETYEWYRSRLQKFATFHPSLPLASLRPFHVQRWLDSFRGVASATKRNYARSIIRVMHWSLAQGLIDRNPLVGFRKPRCGRREVVVSPDEFVRLLNFTRNRCFRDLLCFAWETGARASECLAIEKRHLDRANERIVFPASEEKMGRAPRVIYLNAAAMEIVERLVATATDRVFRNSRGRPWTTDAVNCAFQQLRIREGKRIMKERGLRIPESDVNELTHCLRKRWEQLGRPGKTKQEFREVARARLWNKHAARYAPAYCLTVLRHSWCQRALKSGLDALTVSQLMGHVDVSMVARVYSHLSHAPDFLKSVEGVQKRWRGELVAAARIGGAYLCILERGRRWGFSPQLLQLRREAKECAATWNCGPKSAVEC